MKYCKFHHFADNTNLLSSNNSIKKINKQVGHDIKYLSYWLNVNKICLNPIQDGGWRVEGGAKGPPTSFFTVTSINVEIRSKNFLNFSFNPFVTLV